MANMEFGGEETFTAPRERVYAAIVDLDALAASIPDCTSSKRIDDRTLEATVRPGFSFLRGSMKLRLAFDELVPPAKIVQRIEAAGIGVSMKVRTQMDLVDDAAAGGTKITWQTEVTELKGLIATVSPGLVRAAADQVVRQGWDQLRSKL